MSVCTKANVSVVSAEDRHQEEKEIFSIEMKSDLF
jgi:hypothetical protein